MKIIIHIISIALAVGLHYYVDHQIAVIYLLCVIAIKLDILKDDQ